MFRHTPPQDTTNLSVDARTCVPKISREYREKFRCFPKSKSHSFVIATIHGHSEEFGCDDYEIGCIVSVFFPLPGFSSPTDNFNSSFNSNSDEFFVGGTEHKSVLEVFDGKLCQTT